MITLLMLTIAAPPIYTVSKETKAFYVKQRELRRRPTLSTPQLLVAPNSEAVSFMAELTSFEDGGLLVSKAVSPEVFKHLQRLGARVVESEKQLGDHTLFAGRYFKRFAIAPKGPSSLEVENLIGLKVKLTLVRMLSGRTMVMRIRGAR